MTIVITPKDRELLASRHYREFLRTELAERCAKKKLYSMRAFARDLECSVSSLCTVLSGKTHFSKATIHKMAAKLQKAEPVREYFVNLALAEMEAPGDTNNPHYVKAKEIRLQHLYVPAEVPHRMLNSWSLAPLALTLLLEIESEVRTDEALQKRLGVSSEELKKMIDELESIGWIQKTPDGPGTKIRFMELGNRGNAYEIRALHKKALDRAQWCLENMPFEQRYFYTAFFTMIPDNAREVSDKLRKHALTLAEEQGKPAPGHEVYAIGTYLVPLTQSVEAQT
ncbi:TIGR02147 family protein [Oligoflexus tunisiensis]|uniref:TIGR02147 family protein n=1 Tax=Oligoflexus tunisiensis TaxID=708132 RepID=UPI00114C8D75|nr:TIGR02147 family protein [Oligoflexus tunisiensis]